jgi:uncharacterized membrane-anchored protein
VKALALPSAAASRWLVGLCAALASFAAPAQPADAAQAEFQAAVQAVNKVLVAGPAQIRLADQAVLNLPKNLAYIPAAEAGRFLAAMGNLSSEGLLGVVLSLDPGAGWFAVMRLFKPGYIRDDDPGQWQLDELLSSMQKGTEAANKARRSAGFAEVEIVGWIDAPKYDAAAHRLAWSFASRNKDAPDDRESGANYNTSTLGRDGFISVNIVTDVPQMQVAKPAILKLLASLQYNDGKRYRDFDAATDRVSGYGLGALMGGIRPKKPAPILAFILEYAMVIGFGALGIAGATMALLERKKKAAAS